LSNQPALFVTLCATHVLPLENADLLFPRSTSFHYSHRYYKMIRLLIDFRSVCKIFFTCCSTAESIRSPSYVYTIFACSPRSRIPTEPTYSRLFTMHYYLLHWKQHRISLFIFMILNRFTLSQLAFILPCPRLNRNLRLLLQGLLPTTRYALPNEKPRITILHTSNRHPPLFFSLFPAIRAKNLQLFLRHHTLARTDVKMPFGRE
jgi:hypothetical protein